MTDDELARALGGPRGNGVAEFMSLADVVVEIDGMEKRAERPDTPPRDAEILRAQVDMGRRVLRAVERCLCGSGG